MLFTSGSDAVGLRRPRCPRQGSVHLQHPHPERAGAFRTLEWRAGAGRRKGRGRGRHHHGHSRQLLPAAVGKRRRGPELTKVPWFSVGLEDGTAARELLDKGEPVKVHLSLATETRNNVKAVASYGVLPGATDENVLVLAHTDGFWEGGRQRFRRRGDARPGRSTCWRIPKEQRRRTITFMSPIGHHVTPDLSLAKMHENRATVFAEARADHQRGARHDYADLHAWGSAAQVECRDRAPFLRWAQQTAGADSAEQLPVVRGGALYELPSVALRCRRQILEAS